MKLTILASVAVVASTITAMPSAPLDPRAEKCTTQCCAKWRNICLLGCGGGPEHALCVSKQAREGNKDQFHPEKYIKYNKYNIHSEQPHQVVGGAEAEPRSDPTYEGREADEKTP
ncbi:hypothetical protein PMIN01_05091 [Paraphaeosphaeria minitans]|uniref:Uncharacterized protein n=1 Tax=Paraphaeosphaeria minitans TaxID=565426 RepID=A0A9P6GKA3_9PLEO|nr:hypothetical protein PMIN01_05091 [Paraphaeosphaeria minitans]